MYNIIILFYYLYYIINYIIDYVIYYVIYSVIYYTMTLNNMPLEFSRNMNKIFHAFWGAKLRI